MTDAAPDAHVEDIYELSPMQLGMLFQTLLQPAAGMFVEQQVSTIPGAIHPALFADVWNRLIERTPVLRTSFHWRDIERPVQVVHRRVSFSVDYFDWQQLPGGERDKRLTQLAEEWRRGGFDLEAPPLMRAALIRVNPQETRFVWQFHHILLDGWSAPLLLEELLREYAALATGRPSQPRDRRPYRAYIDWLQLQDGDAAEQFWREELRGFDAPTRLGIERGGAAQDPREASDQEHEILLSNGDSDLLRAFAKERRVTLNTVFQGAWALLLSRYSQEGDVVFGAVLSGRPPALDGVEEMIGLFINTLPVRVRVAPEADVSSWLAALQRRQLETASHQHVSALDIQRWTTVPSGTRLFNSVVIFENFPVPAQAVATSGDAQEPICIGRADVPLSVIVIPQRAMRVKFAYDRAVFEPAAVERLAEHLRTLLLELCERPAARLREISMLESAERRRLLADWNATAHPGYDRQSVVQILEHQAVRTPDAVAFIDGDTKVSVAAIHERSSQLAHCLAAKGIGMGSVVGVCVERSIEAVIALLALWKCRAVFLPLDPSYPRERLAYMAADAHAELVLGVDPSLAPAARVIGWNELWTEAAGHSFERPTAAAAVDDLAYILYTSGSTGRPKGVAVEHRAVLNRLAWMWREYPLNAGDVGVLKTPLNFVDAFWEMLGPLLQGFPTVIARQPIVADPNAFVDLLAAHRVTRMWFVPSFLELLLESCPDVGRRLPALKYWWSGGEPLTIDLYQRFRAAVPHGVLYNVLGASEVWDVTVFDPERDGSVGNSVPIGRPIANTEVYVLDREHQAVPIGVTGSLLVGGACLPRGYVNQAALAGDRFIAHPFSGTPGARLYDTGDLVRYRPDGLLEYVGRRDLQLNVRGFRVEPTEIESLLETHPSVRESVVVCHGSASGDRRLVAYVVPNNGTGETDVLLSHLRAWLPSFMVPAIAWIDEIPMTPSGKKDRDRLRESAPADSRPTVRREPATVLEQLVLRQFSDVLGSEALGMDDDFFVDLGGHSLLATRLVSRLRESTGLDVPLRAIFDAPTPAALAALLQPQFSGVATDEETAAIVSELATLPAVEAEALLALLEDGSEGAPR